MTQNRLGRESSPYLLSHADNPVDWYPWGEEAFSRARALDRPIFLSIGYSACHWCHVMEFESFSDPITARLLNDHFVSIKVDREERPDIDQIYMTAVQLLSQRGGWPLSAFLTPSLLPFYGGTYYPPEDRYAVPSFQRVLSGILQAWQGRRNELILTSERLSQSVKEIFESTPQTFPLPPYSDLLNRFISQVNASYDSTNGGFGSAPKFFHTERLRNYLRHSIYTGAPNSLSVVTHTLDRISRGGVCDQLGGGFHRYSTDAEWLVPHFEKMLYDNALLTGVLIDTFRVTGELAFADSARAALDFVLREMTAPDGCFYSTLDADTEGEEGHFYTWADSAIRQTLPAQDAEIFCKYFGVTPSGNFESSNILHTPLSKVEFSKLETVQPDALDDTIIRSRRRLLAVRNSRVRPHLDCKVITSWNGMMIESFAKAAIALNDTNYLDAATQAAEAVWRKMRGRGRIGHSVIDGTQIPNGFLDDHAYFLNALVELFLATQNPTWLERAIILAQNLVSHFWDSRKEIFYFNSHEDPVVIARTRDNHDGATPSAASTAALALSRLGHIVGDGNLLDIARRALASASQTLIESPQAAGQWIIAADFLLNDAKVLVFCPGPSQETNDKLINLLRARLLPNQCLLIQSPELTNRVTALASRIAVNNEETLYVCSALACEAPVIGYTSISSYSPASAPEGVHASS